MKNAFRLALVLSLVSLPTLALAETLEETAEKVMRAMEEMAILVDKDKDNCDTMAVDLSAFADQNAALIAKGNQLKKDATPEQNKALAEKYRKRGEAMGEKMKPGTLACYKNERVKAAFAKIHPR